MLALRIRKVPKIKIRRSIKREVRLSAKDIEKLELYFTLAAYCGR